MQQAQYNGYQIDDPPGSVRILLGAIAATFVVMLAVVLQASTGATAGSLLAAVGVD
jgi:hypothetical protein